MVNCYMEKVFCLMLTWAVCQSCVGPAILYGGEVECLTESEIGILCRTERSVVRAMCEVQLKEGKLLRN